ncbi:TlpA family protein disulfide reductase [Sandaracinobacteroides saxicola]|uniref:TlpA family protein disulfide reductase n=1 Tax=Sandaracinobacteroides saxicola TaxID=2759707 RepID=A0A7G5IIV0_9SPHN|nr:TlpA disulfide reductase family protein [Sandaracinobacteroides saxicola]QMW23292.1 TlpA family protein disulfide reductase [Sandaracinobacteroides saxicola]
MRLTFIALLSLAACGQAPAGDREKAPPSQAALNAAEAPPVALAAKIDRSQAGKPAPTVPFEMSNGGATKTVADFRGKPVLVNLWATWCAPCIKEMPALDTLAKTLGDRVTVLAVSQDMEGWRAVDKFFTPGKFTTVKPQVDSAMAYGAAIGAKGLPVTILYDAAGKEVWRINGDYDWASAEAEALVVG